MVYGLFIIATYFCSALVIHLAYSRRNLDAVQTGHYVIYTLDNQQQIEWIIRSLIVFHWLQGRSISITIFDEGSSDDTLAILNLLSKHHQLDIRHLNDQDPHLPPLSDTSIHIRLSTPEDLHKLPQLSALW